MKVYVVTEGSYSDYEISGIYSTRELAELAAKSFGTQNDIEEYELDVDADKLKQGFHYFRVAFAEDGTIRFAEKTAPFEDDDFQLYALDTGNNYNGGGCITVWARDKEHAIKIYSERRSALIASGQYRPGETRGFITFNI